MVAAAALPDHWRCAPLTGVTLLDLQIAPDRDMVRWLLLAARALVDAAIGEPVDGLRRQGQVVDAQTVVLLPGAGLVMPEGVVAGLRISRRDGVGVGPVVQLAMFRT